MKNILNLSTRVKLFLGFGTIWVFLIVITTVASIEITRFTSNEASIRDHQLKTALNLMRIRLNLNYNRAAMLEMIITKEREENIRLKNEIEKRVLEMNDCLVELKADQENTGSKDQLKIMQDTLVDYWKTRSVLIRNIMNGDSQGAVGSLTGIQEDRFLFIQDESFNLGKLAQNNLNQYIERDLATARILLIVFLALGVVSLILGIFMIRFLNASISDPLNRLSGLLEKISHGDLTVEVPPLSRTDEVGKLNLAMTVMTGNLKSSTKDIAEAVNLLSASASEILASTTQVASGTAETASAISETSSTVEEVRQAAQMSAEKAKEVADSAKGVLKTTQEGKRAVEETIQGMERIRSQMDSIATTIMKLSDQSQSIGNIIAMVSDVSDQSNLLAVNAAIEAAKAGEFGKGFAVVAEEIKRLADQSKKSTIQVRNILNDIQKATSAAVMAAEQGGKAVEAGVKQSNQAGEAIRLLAESSGEASRVATQIAASSSQQLIGMDQIGLAMENINQAGEQTEASMKQTELAAQGLNELGHKLKELVRQYKI